MWVVEDDEISLFEVDEEPEADPPLLPDDHGAALREPLAERLRPRSLEEVVGQEHLVGPNGTLQKILDRGLLHQSMILWGPAGTGKTTIAKLLCQKSGAYFVSLSATSAGAKEIKEAGSTADRMRAARRSTILFFDEIHRLSKLQQDYLLPMVESGQVTLIGATTENPYFEVNGPLLSRCILLRLEPLGADTLRKVIGKGLEELGATADDDLVGRLAAMASGDARQALTILDVVFSLACVDQDTDSPHLTLDALESTAALSVHQMGAENLYDERAAWIQSMNGSDPDAAIYWMVRLLEGGEDPKYLGRRLMVLAAEDIGQADPTALLVASAAMQSAQVVGMPECALILAQATIHLACAPKSNKSAVALWQAQEYVRSNPDYPVPLVNRSREHPSADKIGSGKGYRYPHDEPGAVAAGQQYMPDELVGHRFYNPSRYGQEVDVYRRLQRISQGLGHEEQGSEDEELGWE